MYIFSLSHTVVVVRKAEPSTPTRVVTPVVVTEPPTAQASTNTDVVDWPRPSQPPQPSTQPPQEQPCRPNYRHSTNEIVPRTRVTTSSYPVVRGADSEALPHSYRGYNDHNSMYFDNEVARNEARRPMYHRRPDDGPCTRRVMWDDDYAEDRECYCGPACDCYPDTEPIIVSHIFHPCDQVW